MVVVVAGGRDFVGDSGGEFAEGAVESVAGAADVVEGDDAVVVGEFAEFVGQAFPEPGHHVGLSRGLGNLRSSRGEFVFFTAAPGEVALDLLPDDDDTENSVFTRVFLKHFRQGAYLEDVANDVQEEVLELSRQANIIQEPYYSDGVAGKTCIDAECGTVSAPSGGGSELEATYWRLCETRDTLSYCKAYIKSYPANATSESSA